MDDESIRRWAQGGRVRSPQRRSGETSPGTPAAAGPQLPQPPPGYVWAWNGAQWIHVALPGAPPISTPSYGPPPTYQPGAAPGQVLQFPARAKTNVLVREGDVDVWANKLAELPNLPVQDPFLGNQYDAMAGRISPQSLDALRPLAAEYPEAGQMLDLPLKAESSVRLTDTHRDRGGDRS